ncbi:hypothetical protein KCU64_g3811, partial [Aureobasidium melanogenum]
MDSWTIYFSINTVVSTLGVVFKSTLFIAVSAALAQGKWTWFRKRNSPLSTFEAIDAASRDTLESFKLLWRMRGRHLVSAGALVIALGFMVDPFLQAIISDYGRLVNLDASAPNSTRATIGKLNRFDGGTQCVTTYPSKYPKIDTTPDFAVAAALYDGLNAAISHSYQNHLLRSFKSLEKNNSRRYGRSKYLFDWKLIYNELRICDYLHRRLIDDLSTLNSGAIASTNTPQTSSEDEAPGYSAAPLATDVTAFSNQMTPNSVVARSIATKVTSGLEKRASSSVQMFSTPTQSSSTWTNWTLEHLNLTLSNTNPSWRKAQTFAVLQAAVVADPNKTINFVASQALLAAFTIIRTDNTDGLGTPAWDAASASAMECGLELTLNVYNSSVRNNVLVENIVASASDKVPGSWLPSLYIDQNGVDPNHLSVDRGTPESNPIYHRTFLWRDDYALDPTALQTHVKENFTVTQKGLVSTLDFLTSLVRQDNDNATVKAVVNKDQPVLYTYGSAVLQPLFNQANTTATFDAIARSMSNAIRNVGKDSMSGTAQQWVRYYQVRWAFLALPLSLFTIGSIFFALSIMDAHRLGVPSWKANNTAIMLHGPDELLYRDLRNKSQDHSLGVTGEILAKLEWFPEGYALVAANEPVAQISRTTTPVRDVEEHEMSNLKIPTTPQTPGSNITLVNSQSVGEASEQGTMRSVSPVYNSPGWSDVRLDNSSAPPSVRRSV